jgi:hypothetical protein
METIVVKLINLVFPHTIRMLCGPTISGLCQYNNFGFTLVTCPQYNSHPRSLFECTGFSACPTAGSIFGSPVAWCCPGPSEIQFVSPQYPRISVILAGDFTQRERRTLKWKFLTFWPDRAGLCTTECFYLFIYFYFFVPSFKAYNAEHIFNRSLSLLMENLTHFSHTFMNPTWRWAYLNAHSGLPLWDWAVPTPKISLVKLLAEHGHLTLIYHLIIYCKSSL